ncbi:MAG: stage II sporulation protein M [Clostridia bacterium]|nr:stage II sporulation protein M [Clostridia bacterium]
MFGRNSKKILPMTIVLVCVFGLGLILGTLALFYLPEDVLNEARLSFDPFASTDSSFPEAFRESFMTEVLWLLGIWLLGSMNFTAPFSCAVLSLRGFVIGFSVAFVITGGGDWVRFLLYYILPQCLAALPLMSIFVLLCTLHAVERKHKGQSRSTYLALGAVFIMLCALTATFEAWIAIYLIK